MHILSACHYLFYHLDLTLPSVYPSIYYLSIYLSNQLVSFFLSLFVSRAIFGMLKKPFQKSIVTIASVALLLYHYASETRHGRVAMAAFVGYCVQSNFHFPWPMRLDGTPFPSTDLSPPEQWAALPIESKHQIITVIGFLEIYSELASSVTDPDVAQDHYMRGGKPGAFPKFGAAVPHPVPFDLYDPFNWSKSRSEEAKAKGLVMEVNNGRLAMLGIFGFLCAQTIPGSVPLLADIVKPYGGDLIAGKAFTFY